MLLAALWHTQVGRVPVCWMPHGLVMRASLVAGRPSQHPLAAWLPCAACHLLPLLLCRGGRQQAAGACLSHPFACWHACNAAHGLLHVHTPGILAVMGCTTSLRVLWHACLVAAWPWPSSVWRRVMPLPHLLPVLQAVVGG